jgi:hypothetical protein
MRKRVRLRMRKDTCEDEEVRRADDEGGKGGGAQNEGDAQIVE